MKGGFEGGQAAAGGVAACGRTAVQGRCRQGCCPPHGVGSGGAGVWAAAGSSQTKGEGLMVSWISLLVVSAGTRLPGNANQPSLTGMQPRLTPGTHMHTHWGCCGVSDTHTRTPRSSVGSTTTPTL